MQQQPLVAGVNVGLQFRAAGPCWPRQHPAQGRIEPEQLPLPFSSVALPDRWPIALVGRVGLAAEVHAGRSCWPGVPAEVDDLNS